MASMCLIRKICVRRNIAVPSLGNEKTQMKRYVTVRQVITMNTVFKNRQTTQEAPV